MAWNRIPLRVVTHFVTAAFWLGLAGLVLFSKSSPSAVVMVVGIALVFGGLPVIQDFMAQGRLRRAGAVLSQSLGGSGGMVRGDEYTFESADRASRAVRGQAEAGHSSPRKIGGRVGWPSPKIDPAKGRRDVDSADGEALKIDDGPLDAALFIEGEPVQGAQETLQDARVQPLLPESRLRRAFT